MLDLAYLITYLFFIAHHVIAWVLGSDTSLSSLSFLFPIFSLLSVYFVFLSGLGFGLSSGRIVPPGDAPATRPLLRTLSYLLVADACRQAMIFGLPYAFQWGVIQLIALSLGVIHVLSPRGPWVLAGVTLLIYLTRDSFNALAGPLFESSAVSSLHLDHGLRWGCLAALGILCVILSARVLGLDISRSKKLNMTLVIIALGVWCGNAVLELAPFDEASLYVARNSILGAFAIDPKSHHAFSFFVWFPVVSSGALVGHLYRRSQFFASRLKWYAVLGVTGLLLMNVLFFIAERRQFSDLLTYLRVTGRDDYWGHHVLSFVLAGGPMFYLSNRFRESKSAVLLWAARIRRGMYPAFFSVTLFAPKICFFLRDSIGKSAGLFLAFFSAALLGLVAVWVSELIVERRLVVRLRRS